VIHFSDLVICYANILLIWMYLDIFKCLDTSMLATSNMGGTVGVFLFTSRWWYEEGEAG
jgi:hypothetical protein